MIDNKIEIMNTLMRMNRKMASRGPKQGGPMLGRAQMAIIKEIIDNPGISQDQIAVKVLVDKTTVAKSVKKLEEHGMITRVRSQEDSRKYAVTATDKAIKIRDKVKEAFDKRSKILFKNISDDEIEAFGATLKKLENNIEKNREDMNMNRRRTGMVIARAIMHKPGITEEGLIVQTDMNKKQMKKALEIMKEKGLIRFEGDGIYPTEKAIEIKQTMRGKGPGGTGRPHMKMH